MFMGHGFSAGDPAMKRQKSDGTTLVLPWHRNQPAQHLHFDAEFLAKFARERCLRSLAIFHLAAGKLPQAAKVFARGPQTRQHAASRVMDHTTNHINHAARSLMACLERSMPVT